MNDPTKIRPGLFRSYREAFEVVVAWVALLGIFLMAVFVVVSVLNMGGCAESVELARAREAVREVQAEVNTIELRLAQSADPEEVAQLRSQLTETQKTLSLVQDALAAAEGEEPSPELLSVLPPEAVPYGLLALTLWRAWVNRRAGRSVASSVQYGLAGITEEAAATVRRRIAASGQQGHAAKRLVDEAQAKKIPLPL